MDVLTAVINCGRRIHHDDAHCRRTNHPGRLESCL